MIEKKTRRMLVIPGMFVPSNDTVTLLTYKRIKHIEIPIDIFALKAKIDKGIEEKLKEDESYKKMNIFYFGDYDKTITISKPYLLPLGLINMQRYVSRCYKEYKKTKHQYIYTSSIPGITHICGWKIKRNFPDVVWYASFSDPIKGSPYKKDPRLKKRSLLYKILFSVGSFIYMNNEYERKAIQYADKLIFICEEQRDFTAAQYPELKDSIIERSIILPLCYDEQIQTDILSCAKKAKPANSKINAVHLGRIYGLRDIGSFLEAIKELKEDQPDITDKIVFNQYSEIQKEDLKYIKDNSLEDLFVVHDKVSYGDSLAIMQSADVLLLFDTIMENESVQPYLPSKIIEYLILKKPILSVCGPNSPSYRILKLYGHNYCGTNKDIIKKNIVSLMNDKQKYNYNIDKMESRFNCLKLTDNGE